MEEAIAIQCPSCGEPTELIMAPEEQGGETITDCTVCCRPILCVIIQAPDGSIDVNAERC